MSTYVLVLDNKSKANVLIQRLQEDSTPILRKELVRPINIQVFENHPKEESQIPDLQKPVDFSSIELLNPKLAREKRQKRLSLWLMPFGFVTGIAFTQMTELQTFSNLGFPGQLEALIGGLLGMGSGLIGSFFSAGSINQDIDDDIRTLQKKSKEGMWLLIIQTQIDMELPWQIIQQTEIDEIVNLNDY